MRGRMDEDEQTGEWKEEEGAREGGIKGEVRRALKGHTGDFT